VLGRRYGPAPLSVSPEAFADSANRPGIALTADRARIAMIGVKVLARLGPKRLERYQEAVPGANVYAGAAAHGACIGCMPGR
jgi:hypothetical protein